MNRVLFALLLPGAPEYLLGDLEEEAAAHSRLWFLRHVCIAAAHEANLLETAAATAFLIGVPLTLALELRRFALTLIPYRESADFSHPSLLALAVAVAVLAHVQTRSLQRRRLAAAAAVLCTASIVHLTQSPQFLTAAALLGGSLATLQPKRDNQ